MVLGHPDRTGFTISHNGPAAEFESPTDRQHRVQATRRFAQNACREARGIPRFRALLATHGVADHAARRWCEFIAGVVRKLQALSTDREMFVICLLAVTGIVRPLASAAARKQTAPQNLKREAGESLG